MISLMSGVKHVRILTSALFATSIFAVVWFEHLSSRCIDWQRLHLPIVSVVGVTYHCKCCNFVCLKILNRKNFNIDNMNIAVFWAVLFDNSNIIIRCVGEALLRYWEVFFTFEGSHFYFWERVALVFQHCFPTKWVWPFLLHLQCNNLA